MFLWHSFANVKESIRVVVCSGIFITICYLFVCCFLKLDHWLWLCVGINLASCKTVVKFRDDRSSWSANTSVESYKLTATLKSCLLQWDIIIKLLWVPTQHYKCLGWELFFWRKLFGCWFIKIICGFRNHFFAHQNTPTLLISQYAKSFLFVYSWF